MLQELNHLIQKLTNISGSLLKPSELELSPKLSSLKPIIQALLNSPVSREGLINLCKLVSLDIPFSWPISGKTLTSLVSILTSGPELTRLIVRRPARLINLLEDPTLGRAWSKTDFEQSLDYLLDGVTDIGQFAERLALFRNDQFIRLAASEFGLAPLEQVGYELSLLADVLLDRTLSFVLKFIAKNYGPPLYLDENGVTHPCPVTAIGMGKYGAQELNFCSDIDVVFIYQSDEGHAGSLTLHEFFSKVCQQVTRILSEINSEGFCFRVDLRLRPEGSRGPICNSLDSIERYYEIWGGPYDRLAWLKARTAAGNQELGQRIIQLLKPFVFPRSIHHEVVSQIQELYHRIQIQPKLHTVPGWNVKLDQGGIRAIEFFVQALQLLHAGKREILQERATLRALDKLLFVGLISEFENRQLGECYELWRHIEHQLQLYGGQQTHLLPNQGPLREQIAAQLGLLPVSRFDAELERRRKQVTAIYSTLEASSDATSIEELKFSPLIDPEISSEMEVSLLAQAGFQNLERAAELIHILASKPWGPIGLAFSTGSSTLALALLSEISRSPDPDAALSHFVKLTLRLGTYDGFWTLLEKNRPLLRVLCSLFGSSDYLARLFVDRPDLLDQLLFRGVENRYLNQEQLSERLDGQLAAVEPDDVESRLKILGRFRTEEVLRIGLWDIAGDLELHQVWEQLTALAETILAQIYPMVLAEVIGRYGVPRHQDGQPAALSIISLGKLGGREMTYASDLDLIFIYSDEGHSDGARSIDNHEFFTRVVQRLIRTLSTTLAEGTLYQVDTRLRPSGKQGVLVSSFQAFQEYHQSAQTWERQILIKARHVGGDVSLGRKVEEWIQAFIFSVDGSPVNMKHDICRLRQRMEKELGAETRHFYNLKFGHGGLIDIEFLIQYLQLCYGAQHISVRVRSSLDALGALQQEEIINPQVAASLKSGYTFLRKLESRLRMVRDRSDENVPRTAKELEIIARRLGYREQKGETAGERLLSDYQYQTAKIRRIFEELINTDEKSYCA